LVKTQRADGPLLRIAGAALIDLESGAWQPRFVLMHGDLWRGNVMLPGRPRAMLRALRSGAFAVIDWGGSDPDGIPFFDLLRALDSFGASTSTARSYLHTYSATLELPITDAPKYLASAWAYVLANSAHMPRELFETAQQRSFDLLGRAMPA
jgi:aminoglycoside phosphotransferase (APT) family kinase protein